MKDLIFREIRRQTGEAPEVAEELRSGKIARVDVDDQSELEWFVNRMAQEGFYRVSDARPDRAALDIAKEVDFDSRITFSSKKDASISDSDFTPAYIDFFIEMPAFDEYDPMGEM